MPIVLGSGEMTYACCKGGCGAGAGSAVYILTLADAYAKSTLYSLSFMHCTPSTCTSNGEAAAPELKAVPLAMHTVEEPMQIGHDVAELLTVLALRDTVRSPAWQAPQHATRCSRKRAGNTCLGSGSPKQAVHANVSVAAERSRRECRGVSLPHAHDGCSTASRHVATTLWPHSTLRHGGGIIGIVMAAHHQHGVPDTLSMDLWSSACPRRCWRGAPCRATPMGAAVCSRGGSPLLVRC